MLNTLHISQIDDSVMLALRHKAQEMHISVEELVRRYLREIGARPMETNGRKRDKNSILEKEFGSWSEEEFQEFERNTAPMREIDPDLWK